MWLAKNKFKISTSNLTLSSADYLDLKQSWRICHNKVANEKSYRLTQEPDLNWCLNF